MILKQNNKNCMDSLSIGFCEKLSVVNGFVTEIIAGHITRIGREADLARMPPETGKAGILASPQTLQK